MLLTRVLKARMQVCADLFKKEKPNQRNTCDIE